MQHVAVEMLCCDHQTKSVRLESWHTQVASDVINLQFLSGGLWNNYPFLIDCPAQQVTEPNHTRLITTAVSDSPLNAENIGATLLVIQESVWGPRTLRPKQGQRQISNSKTPFNIATCLNVKFLLWCHNMRKNYIMRVLSIFSIWIRNRMRHKWIQPRETLNMQVHFYIWMCL